MALSSIIIDAHTHIFPENIRKDRRPFCQRDIGFQTLYENPKARLAGFEDLIASMDHNRIEWSIICGFPWGDPGLCREANDYLFWAKGQAPGRIIAFPSLPRSSRRSMEREFSRCLAQGCNGIGELGFYPDGISEKEGERLACVLEPLSQLGIPILLHVNEPVGHSYAGKICGDLRWVYELLLRLPRQRIILAHWGGGFFFYELMPEVAEAARNVLYDTAASPYLYDPAIYSLALNIVGAERILFGSDYPLLSPRRYFSQWEKIRLPRKARVDIRGGNAYRLLIAQSQGGTKRSILPRRTQGL